MHLTDLSLKALPFEEDRQKDYTDDSVPALRYASESEQRRSCCSRAVGKPDEDRSSVDIPSALYK